MTNEERWKRYRMTGSKVPLGDGFVMANTSKSPTSRLSLSLLKPRLPSGGGSCKLFKITSCEKASGLAAVTEQTLSVSGGNLTTTNASETAVAFIGVGSWWRVDDLVWCVELDTAVGDLKYVAVQGWYGPYFWEPPETEELSEVQDNPDPDAYCEESVST